MIEDDSEEPSRVGTPAIMEEKTSLLSDAASIAEGPVDGNEKSEKMSEKPAQTPAAPKVNSELPQEVRAKLRKLEMLEGKYKGTILQSLLETNA